MAQQKNTFKKLNRLFATNTIIRQTGKKKLGVKDLDSKQSYSTNLISRYQRLYQRNSEDLYGLRAFGSTVDIDRMMRYTDYEIMDADPLVSSVLDIYSEECTTTDENGDMLSINSKNKKIKKILNNLFYDILNIEFNLAVWIRNMCKYGDFFLILEISPQFGIVNVYPYSVYELDRQDGTKQNPDEIRFLPKGDIQNNRNRKYFFNFETVHFRLLTDTNLLPYGKSLIESSRRIWKQIQLMEDAMMIYRIMRAPERRIFYVDVGNLPPNEVDVFMNKTISRIKKAPVIDKTTGEYNLRYNIQNVAEDFFFPTRGDKETTRIDTLPGGSNTSDIEDIEYLQKKIFSAWKIPKSFLGYEDELGQKSTLAMEDIRFSRSINKIQKIVTRELTKIAMIHLYTQGYRDEDLIDFELSLTNPSTIHEQQKIELFESKLNAAESAKNSELLPLQWIYEKVFNFTQDEIKLIKRLILEDKKWALRLDQIELGNDPAISNEIVPREGGTTDTDEDEKNRTSVFNFDTSFQKADDLVGPEIEKVGKRTVGNKPELDYSWLEKGSNRQKNLTILLKERLNGNKNINSKKETKENTEEEFVSGVKNLFDNLDKYIINKNSDEIKNN